ncbi:unnamed protein product [Durusdinium trenchii]|uniref:Uncharacterized protein n=1 Tax=Durusdinium trenchii TaxID=1381693 RepID=A0ABP0RDX0_9DINO
MKDPAIDTVIAQAEQAGVEMKPTDNAPKKSAEDKKFEQEDSARKFKAIGPPRAPEVPLEWLAFLREKGPRDAGNPAWPADRYEVWVFATRFILREQELACIYMKEVDLNPRLLQVTLNLPVTKNDPSGRGARRTLGCICKSSPEEKSTCPYCTALHLVQRQGHRLMTTSSSAEVMDAPLIGQQEDPMLVVEKAAMIEAFKHDARRLSHSLPEASALATNEDAVEHTIPANDVYGLASGWLREPRATLLIRTEVHKAQLLRASNNARIMIRLAPHGLHVESPDDVEIEAFEPAQDVSGHDTVPMALRGESFHVSTPVEPDLRAAASAEPSAPSVAQMAVEPQEAAAI